MQRVKIPRGLYILSLYYWGWKKLEMAYSFHLGSDKNKKGTARNAAKKNRSGTTSLANNAIQHAKALSKSDKHNCRKYDNNKELIEIIVGTDSLYEDVKKLYLEEFEEARIEYNNKQTREDRKINDYFKKISDSSKYDLACEIIIELGDKEFWDTKDMSYKKRMSNVFKEQVKDLEMLMPDFKIASAIIHYDETSPHMHIIGIPIKYNCKSGMKKQVGKSSVFTREVLRMLQDKMRALCIAAFNKEYGLIAKLKTKLKGRNRDINVKDMDGYQKTIKEMDKKREKLDKANKKSLDLDNMSKDIKDIVNNLKNSITNKEKLILKKEEKQKLLNYINEVNKVNKEFKSFNTLSVDIKALSKNMNEQLQLKDRLEENNEALNLKVDMLNKTIKKKDEEIKELKKENTMLNNLVDYFENKFNKLKRFIRNKVFSKNKETADKYDEFVDDICEANIINEDDVDYIYGPKDYDYNEHYNYDNDNKKDDIDFSI